MEPLVFLLAACALSAAMLRNAVLRNNVALSTAGIVFCGVFSGRPLGAADAQLARIHLSGPRRRRCSRTTGQHLDSGRGASHAFSLQQG